MATTSNVNAAALALNRFGLGARADDTPPADPKGWLLAQFEQYQPRPAAWTSQPDSVALAAEFEQQRVQNRQNRQAQNQQAQNQQAQNQQAQNQQAQNQQAQNQQAQNQQAQNQQAQNQQAQNQQAQNQQAQQIRQSASDAPATQPANAQTASQSDAQAAQQAERKALRSEVLDLYRSSVNARVASALTTQTPFIERLVHFWANHFAVSAEKPGVAVLAGAFEAEAIRPHVLGRFEDMLIAVERHPAMQLFLDQTRSVGPDSVAAMRAAQRNPDRRRGLNENLAREIMELHTLGVRSGYSQEDVTEFARALTGWSVAAYQGAQPNSAPPGSFVFRTALHEPGARTIMGRRYDQSGDEQALAILHDLASAPATAQHIGGKLARHFVSDNPPADVTERLASAFARSGGDLPTVYRALLDMPQAWSPVAVKFKTPWEWTLSSMRGLGWQDLGNLQAAPILTQLGQPVWRPGSPAGYDDIAASWAAPDALVRRVEVAQRFAARVGDRLDARALGQTLLAGSLSAPTAAAVSRAESASTAIALLLVSPDFQRR